MNLAAVWHCRTATVKQVLIDVILDMDSQTTAAERGETDKEMDRPFLFLPDTCLNVLYTVIRGLHSWINTEHSLYDTEGTNSDLIFSLISLGLKFDFLYLLLQSLWSWQNENTHPSPLFSSVSPSPLSFTLPLDQVLQNNLTYFHHQYFLHADDSKRPPKGPTFGDFLSQGRTQGPRGDRGRGRGRGQKPSYR